jgi:hypothetical protein
MWMWGRERWDRRAGIASTYFSISDLTCPDGGDAGKGRGRTSPETEPVLRLNRVSPAHPRAVGANDADLVLDSEAVLGHQQQAGGHQGAEEEEDAFLLGVGLVAVAIVGVFDCEWGCAAARGVCWE